jgi:hypothetical protein
MILATRFHRGSRSVIQTQRYRHSVIAKPTAQHAKRPLNCRTWALSADANRPALELSADLWRS